MIFDDDKETLEKLTYKANDFKRVRNNIHSKLKNQLKKSFPLDWGGVKLVAKDLRYENDKEYSLKEQKDALLKNIYLTKKLKGDLYLYDSKTGELLDELKNKTLMNVPYYTNRGTFIHNGNEYTTLKQSRLKPGIYSRRKANGELESQFNIKRGTGVGYRITLDPASSVYRLNIGQSNVSLYSILHDLGVSDDELRNAWGDSVFETNKSKYDTRALDKVYQKLVPSRLKIKDPTREDRINILKLAFDEQKIDKATKDLTLPDDV